MDNYLIQLIFISVGIILIIIALFRPKKNSEIEEIIEKMFEDFIMQIDLENEDMINKIKLTTQNKVPYEIVTRISSLEQQINKLEQELNNAKSLKGDNLIENEAILSANQKYIEVLKLHKAGSSIEDIVDDTHVSHAEVKFVIELSKKDFKYV